MEGRRLMPDGPGGVPADQREPGMWQQFRRRRVTRTVVLYVSLAFFLVEAALFAAPYVALPAWWIRVVYGAAVLGFPFVVVLAWTYDVTAKGIVKTPEDLGPESPPAGELRFGWALLGAGAIVLGVILRALRG